MEQIPNFSDNVETNTAEVSKIEAEKIFEEQEILEEINQIANLEGHDPGDIALVERVVNASGELICLECHVGKSQLEGSDFKKFEYHYMIEGEHSVGFNANTSIQRVYKYEGDERNYSGGDVVGYYRNGSWDYDPGISGLSAGDPEWLNPDDDNPHDLPTN